jgi:hypothetical protein
MKRVDREKDGEEYLYLIDGEPVLWSDEMALGIIRDWRKRYDDTEVITNQLVFDEDVRIVDEHHVVYTKDGKHLLNCLNDFYEAEYIVKEGVTTICDDAFSWRGNTEKRLILYISRSVRVIGDNLFGEAGGRIIIKE